MYLLFVLKYKFSTNKVQTKDSTFFIFELNNFFIWKTYRKMVQKVKKIEEIEKNNSDFVNIFVEAAIPWKSA